MVVLVVMDLKWRWRILRWVMMEMEMVDYGNWRCG